MKFRGLDSVLYAGNRIHSLMDRLGEQRAIDGPARALERATDTLPSHGPVKDALSGTWLDHALHPMLTDLPIGFWTSAWVLDIVGDERDHDAARRTRRRGRSVCTPGRAHGRLRLVGHGRRVTARRSRARCGQQLPLALYAGSWIARRRGRHAQGVALSWAGATFATVGGFLGGHLVAALGVGVDHTTFDAPIDDWTAAGELDALSDQPTRVDVLGTPVLLQRSGDEVWAIAATCPHRGAPLDEGAVEGDVVTCPWHASRFCLRDGSLRAGPSATGVDSYDDAVPRGHGRDSLAPLTVQSGGQEWRPIASISAASASSRNPASTAARVDVSKRST